MKDKNLVLLYYIRLIKPKINIRPTRLDRTGYISEI